LATEDTGFTIVPKGRIRSKKKPRGRGEVLGEYQEMITAIQSVGGDPLPVHGTTKASLPAAGKKADRLYCVNDGNAKGVFLDTGASIVQVAGNDIKSGTSVPATERADMLFVKTDEPGIYHDNGAAVTKVAGISAVLPRQIYTSYTIPNSFNNAAWDDQLSITIPPGNWIIHCSYEVKPPSGSNGFLYRLRNTTTSTNYLGGDDTRQYATGAYYNLFSGFVYMTNGLGDDTVTLGFKGLVATVSYARNLFLWAIEFLAGG